MLTMRAQLAAPPSPFAKGGLADSACFANTDFLRALVSWWLRLLFPIRHSPFAIRYSLFAIVAAALLFSPALPAEVTITELVPWELAVSNIPSFKVQAHAIEGDSAYIAFSGSGNSQIVRVENLSGAQTRALLVSPSNWTAVSGANQINGGFGLGVFGDYVRMADSNTRAVWHINKHDGTLISHVSYARLLQLTGRPDALLTAANAMNPLTGEMTYYDSRSRSFVIATASNQVDWLITAVQLMTVSGYSTVAEGVTYDFAGNFYWANNETDCIFMRASNGVLQIALTSTAIYAVSGASNVTFGALKYTPGGSLFFLDRISACIYSFNPGAPNPAATLQRYVDSVTISNSVCGTVNLGAFGWYANNLTWNTVNNETGSNCLYRVVPEPAGLAFVILTGLAGSVRSVQLC